jgi:hypothetical protein
MLAVGLEKPLLSEAQNFRAGNDVIKDTTSISANAAATRFVISSSAWL